MKIKKINFNFNYRLTVDVDVDMKNILKIRTHLKIASYGCTIYIIIAENIANRPPDINRKTPEK